ncbi:dienelactone hydrolase family protein [Cytophagales bacterium LB-30]|uniref:Dienelactone hydrolase family protein n=1 Tax=Shiella aurantiaca TaxID=3058365 RepID=A0ABT8F967_9BACT|nr:alpha/beta fold hydrolase [Shiella aurantiaca]MDN4166940.1 dienelactone hydrolase family protein [Shiella aurantiaca]
MQKEISFQYKARYFTLGQFPAPKVWLVFHGYGQLAPYFIRKFQFLADAGHFVIAPEGLHRFYLQDAKNRVGASWMTREERLQDIRNYLSYINQIVNYELKGEFPSIGIIAFSQGAATATRWALQYPGAITSLVLWGGIFPPDIDFEKAQDKFKATPTYFVYGNSDPLITEEKKEEFTLITQKLGISPSYHTFEGKHVLPPQELKHYLTKFSLL